MASVKVDDKDQLSAAEQHQVDRAETTLKELIDELTAKLGALPDTAQVAMADGKMLTGADLKQLWGEIKFVITTRSYGPGYGGSFDYATKTSYIRHDTVTGWDIFPSGAEFITLHELIHSCAPGEAVRQAMWKKYYDENKDDPTMVDRYRDTPEFSEVEEYCYCGARAIMEALNIPVFQGKFTHGYEYGDLTQ